MLATWVWLQNRLFRWRSGQQGQTMIEYAALAAFLVLALVTIWVLLGGRLGQWTRDTVDRIIRGA